MAEIAHKLGVSSSTVSRALRGDRRIATDTRARVRELAEKLGYRPNPLVSALMANRGRRGGGGEVDVIALVTSYGDKEDWRSKEVCRWEFSGIQQRANQLGFGVEVFAVRDYQDDPARLESTLHARGIRGVLLGFSREEEARAPLQIERFAVAGLSAYFRSVAVDRANFHGFYNVQLALERLWQLGYRRPGLVIPELNNRISNNLWSGAFLDWQRRAPSQSRCEPFLPARADDAPAFHRWLDRRKPDSLLVYKIPVRAFLAMRSLSAPKDIGLACLYRTSDEMGNAAGIDGNLSAVGAAALDLVVEKLNANSLGPSAHPKEVLIKGTWHDGPTLRQIGKTVPARSHRKVSGPAPV